MSFKDTGAFLGGGRGRGEADTYFSVGTNCFLFKTKLFQVSAFVKLKLPLVPLILVVAGHSVIKQAERRLLTPNNHPCACYLNCYIFH